MPKRATSARDLILGLLFFGGLFGLAVVTTQLTNTSFTMERHYLTVLFEDVYGIQREDKVLVHGTRYGRVRRVEPVSAQAWKATGRDLGAEGVVGQDQTFQPHVLAVLELEHPVLLNTTYRIFAEDSNLLGGKVISIMPGREGAPPIDGLPEDDGDFSGSSTPDLKQVRLIGIPKPHPITAIGKLVENNLEDLDAFVDNLVQASDNMTDPSSGLLGYMLADPSAAIRADEILTNLSEFAALTTTDGSLLADVTRPDSELRSNVSESVDNVKTFTESLNRDDSVVGALLAADSPMKGQIESILRDGQEFVTKLNQEDSLVGKALASGPDSLGAKVEGTIDSISGAADNISSAAGQVSAWVDRATTNPESLLYQIAEGDLGTSVRNAVDGIDSAVAGFNQYIIDPISRNESLAGLVFNDPDIRKKVDRLVGATLGIVEDAREAAPVTSLGSFIFGGF